MISQCLVWNMSQLKEKIKARLEREMIRRGGKSSDEATSSTLYFIYHFFSGTKPRLLVSTLVLLLVAAVGFKMLRVVFTTLAGV